MRPQAEVTQRVYLLSTEGGWMAPTRVRAVRASMLLSTAHIKEPKME